MGELESNSANIHRVERVGQAESRLEVPGGRDHTDWLGKMAKKWPGEYLLSESTRTLDVSTVGRGRNNLFHV